MTAKKIALDFFLIHHQINPHFSVSRASSFSHNKTYLFISFFLHHYCVTSASITQLPSLLIYTFRSHAFDVSSSLLLLFYFYKLYARGKFSASATTLKFCANNRKCIRDSWKTVFCLLTFVVYTFIHEWFCVVFLQNERCFYVLLSGCL